LHVTSENEAEESRQRINGVPIEIIKNGVDIPPHNPERNWMQDGKLRLLFIGRLHPKKGVENLLRAVSVMKNNDNVLTICGTGDDDYTLFLKDMANELGIADNVHFAGHVEGNAKSKIFWNSDVCIVPSHTENFGMVVAEALAHGVPVITSRGTPWQVLESRGCGWWVENSPNIIVDTILLARKSDLAAMGEKGREWMIEEFSWENVAARMVEAYDSIRTSYSRWYT
jgi:glycosyltransferase involved in cell wall biosynthesis